MERMIRIFKRYRTRIKSTDTTSLSYYLILAIVPAATLISWSASIFQISIEDMINNIDGLFLNEFASSILETVFNGKANYITVSTIVVSLYVVSKGIFNMTIAANRIYELEPFETTQRIRKRIASYFHAVLFILMVLSIVIVIAVVPYILSFLNLSYSITYFSFAVLFLIIFIFNTVLNLYLPYLRLKIKDVWVGSLVSTSGIIVLVGGFNIYLKFSNYSTIYGPLANVVILLLLLNFVANSIYFGIAINAVRYEEKNGEIGRLL